MRQPQANGRHDLGRDSGAPAPGKGLLSNGTAVLIAVVGYEVYRLAAIRLRGLTDLSPEHDLEAWISPAMLAITFPGMGVLANLFAFWPLRRDR